MRSLRHPLIFLPSRLSDIQSSLNRCRLYRVTMFAGIHQQRLPEDEGCLFYYFNYSCQHYQKNENFLLEAHCQYMLYFKNRFFSLSLNTVLARPFQERRYDFAIESKYFFTYSFLNILYFLVKIFIVWYMIFICFNKGQMLFVQYNWIIVFEFI